MEWYYTVEKDRRGPVDEATFHALIARGEIAPDALVWNSGMADWVPCESVASRAETARAVPPPLPVAPMAMSAPGKDWAAKFYFQWLILEFVLGSAFQLLSFAMYYDTPIRLASYLLQGVFWLGMLFGAKALRAQRHTPWDTTRTCIAVPMATGLLYFFWLQCLNWGLFGGTSLLLALPYGLLIAISFATRLVALICAIVGLKALRRVSA